MKGSGPLYAALAGGGLLAVIAIVLAVGGGDGGGEPDMTGPGAETAPPPPPSVRSAEMSDATGPDQPAPAAVPGPAVTSAPEVAASASQPPDTVPDNSDPVNAGRAGETPPLEPVPRFDVVRVSPAGDMVIAGRAEPNAEVHILDKGEPIGATKADDRGEWVFLPSEQLAPGNRELTLSTRGPEGDQHESDRSVIIMVPEAEPEGTEVAEAAPGREPVIISTPRTARATPDVQILQAPEINPDSPISVDVVEYDSEGQIGVAGRAEPETAVRIYVNDQPAGESPTDETGQWRIEPPRDLPPGLYRLRADQVAPTGEVLARVELPFVKEEPAALPQDGRASYVVQPGNSLWRIARSYYGSGFQYIVIYQSNQSQIRDPDLIYPGQIFDIPKSGF